MTQHQPSDAAVYGVDLGKDIFHVVGVDQSGQLLRRMKFRRETLLAFFDRAAPALVGMEACPGSQWLARKLQGLGHRVRINRSHPLLGAFGCGVARNRVALQELRPCAGRCPAVASEAGTCWRTCVSGCGLTGRCRSWGPQRT